MKLAHALARPIILALLGGSLALACGCPATPASKPGPVTPVGGNPMFTADGKHFAASRQYKGECVGGRGGCYSITLEPDGSYRNMLLDAAVTGTYVIAGDQVSLTPNGEAQPTTMTLSADRTKLDDYTYEAATAP